MSRQCQDVTGHLRTCRALLDKYFGITMKSYGGIVAILVDYSIPKVFRLFAATTEPTLSPVGDMIVRSK